MNSTAKLQLFISYSHKDESYLNEFLIHLRGLERTNSVQIWHDRLLLAGSELNPEIEKNLNSAHLAAFLVSPDFLDSWYCVEVELKKMLSRFDNSKVVLYPVIIRPSDWLNSELSRFVSPNKDGNPISENPNPDRAWLEVVEAIRKSVDSISDETPMSNESAPESYECEYQFRDEFARRLNDTEIVLQHPYKQTVKLNDIYIYPDLADETLENSDSENTINSKSLIENLDFSRHVLILGDEQAGKTSLAKIWISRLFKDGHFPIYVPGNSIGTSDISKHVRTALETQYLNLDYESYMNSSTSKILVLDDFTDTRLNIKHQKQLLGNAADTFDFILVFSASAIKFDEPRHMPFHTFQQYEILPLGHLKRDELIERWYCLGQEETIDEQDLQKKVNDCTLHLNSIIRKNILPPKPLYVLVILQQMEVVTPTSFGLTSYGHCYQTLIVGALKNASIRSKDFDQYLNYLSELAYYIFKANSKTLDEREVSDFCNKYSEKFFSTSHTKILNTLVTSGILRQEGLGLRFAYRYIYYFYVAKYITDHLDHRSCKDDVQELNRRIHTEQNANILIFLIHHSKDQYLIDEILLTAMSAFEDTPPATLGLDETAFLSQSLDSLPEKIIEKKNVSEERKKRLQKADLHEERQRSLDNSDDDGEADNHLFQEINKSIRAVEIIGQILRNRQSSLTKEQLYSMAEAAYMAGLRLLSHVLSFTRNNKEEFIEVISSLLKMHSSVGDDQIPKEARRVYCSLCYGIAFAAIKRISNSLGADRLLPVFERIEEENQESFAISLVSIATRLEFINSVPRKEIEQLHKRLQKLPFTDRLLKEIVIQHLYLNYVSRQDTDWIASTLGIPIDTQRRIQLVSKSKKLKRKK